MEERCIVSLLPKIALAASKIALERTEDLKSLCEDRNICIDLSGPDSYWDFQACIYRGKIYTSPQALEHLWATCRYFLHIYDFHAASQKPFPIRENDIPGMEEVSKLFQRARDAEKADKPFRLSPNSINPNDGLPETAAANEFFLMACAFIILHEVGHIYHRHEGWESIPNEKKRADELEADRFAMDWILGRWDETSTDPRTFAKRCMAIALGLSYTACLEIRRGVAVDSSHPTTASRISQFLQLYVDPILGLPKGTSCITATIVALFTFLKYEGHGDPPDNAYETFREFMEHVERSVAERCTKPSK